MLIRKWTASANGLFVTFECPFYNELLPAENEYGRLPRDFEAHALWQYWGLATIAFLRAKANLVDESELSLKFRPDPEARALFNSVANIHGVSPSKMIRYWDVVERQRMALGGTSTELPEEFKFKFWGN